ncbi:growth hormone-regulated TBC protein 1 [Hetaerina americana]|uniref:growth hormone-regulated TBC protein 1 n=1 Tax=Hetaerina americana TaxID=62018 RepID=UPI003A7F501A
MAVSSTFSKVDEYGFERPEDFDYETYEDFMSHYLIVLAKRAKKWTDLFGEGKSLKRNLTVKRYVRKGIPGSLRARVWMSVSGADLMRERASPNLYGTILAGPKDESLVDIVRTDLPRTFPDNIFFTEETSRLENSHRQMLFNVLVAYGHHNREVGYCQGLNYIVGLLLLVTKDEETAFWLLKMLVEHTLPQYYICTMAGLITDIDVLAELVRIKVPEVHAHVTALGLPWAVIATKWFVCLFAEVLPTETVLRIWDCLFYEGSKIIFRVSLTLIMRNKENLLKCSDFSALVECFKEITKDSLVLQCHEFMESIFKTPGSLPGSTITKLRTKISQEKEAKK